MADTTPVMWLVDHLQVIGWPALTAFAWKMSRFFAKKEAELKMEQVKVNETHAKVQETHQSLKELLAEFHEFNQTNRQAVVELGKLREDFHAHALDDKYVQASIDDNLKEIKRKLEA